jgi:hypothetical protein
MLHLACKAMVNMVKMQMPSMLIDKHHMCAVETVNDSQALLPQLQQDYALANYRLLLCRV